MLIKTQITNMTLDRDFYILFLSRKRSPRNAIIAKVYEATMSDPKLRFDSQPVASVHETSSSHARICNKVR